MRKCNTCGVEKPLKDFRQIAYHKCTLCLRKAENEKNWLIKLKCIEYLGGKCKQCGYNKCSAALDFHHRDPLTRSFWIGKKSNRFDNEIKSELDKCDLLCVNCHRETYKDNKHLSVLRKASEVQPHQQST